MKKIIAVIPARWQSSRFPGKPLALLAGKPVIQHVYTNVLKSELFSEVIVATDSDKILAAVKDFGGRAMLTASTHRSGTDRAAEVCRTLDFDLMVNVQGDEPFISKNPLTALVEVFADPQIQAASLMHKISHKSNDPNQVKVVCDNKGFALYFSRAPIPYNRDNPSAYESYGHVGVYAFTPQTLFDFVELAPGKLEQIEKLEQLRLLENGVRIKMVESDYCGFGIDTPNDLKNAQKKLSTLIV